MFSTKEKLEVATCGPGLRAAAVADGKVRLIATLSPGCQLSRVDVPLPPGGKVVSLSADGPAAVTEDGTLWHWREMDKRWMRIGSIWEGE